ncbi:MAG: carboxylating nicotinate-nucleotide diphosphorylase [Dehalococcoidia bacterium]
MPISANGGAQREPEAGFTSREETLDPTLLARLVQQALEEDGAWNDVTTTATVEANQSGRATVLVKGAGVLAGLSVMAATFAVVDRSLDFQMLCLGGTRVQPGDRVATIDGSYASILRGERVALNFLQRLSGVATQTARAVSAAAGTRARIVDTRKTTPGLRYLEKYAVRAGGGHNHRYNLADGILIKDNHLAALRARGLGIADAVRLARERSPHTLRIELEVTSLAEVDEALAVGAEIILLDNMSAEEMRQAVERCRGHALTEASGGIRPETVREVAETGVDLISLGSLTHSAPALDISLELELAE